MIHDDGPMGGESFVRHQSVCELLREGTPTGEWDARAFCDVPENRAVSFIVFVRAGL